MALVVVVAAVLSLPRPWPSPSSRYRLPATVYGRLLLNAGPRRGRPAARNPIGGFLVPATCRLVRRSAGDDEQEIWPVFVVVMVVVVVVVAVGSVVGPSAG